ncbi:uncharacterized protein PAC_18361 [Phialocephala subalpina]|uniref:HTH merR-type domain-containing protein n=1 Tax=Phialocephala subalpina TaxID=576137 RepID=A0A1L7XTV5_9HELO|nr:uncharacterized protein PAC_18361 [Phialocephala subalpina]
MSLEEIKQIISIKNIPRISRDKEAWQNEKADEDMEDEEAIAFIQEVYTRITPTMEKILSGNDDNKLHMEILDANNAIELAELVEASSYPSTWILKPLLEAPKPPPSGGNGTGPTGTTGTAPTGTAPAGVIAGGITDNGTGRTDISTDPYELNKLNARKPGFTEDREMIIGHKFKPQACPHVKVFPRKDFTKNTVNAYLNCPHTIEVSGRTEKDEFIKILCTAAESCGPEPLKEPAIYALCERKEGNPIWIWRTDLQD